MRRRFRTLIVLASTFAMVLVLGAGTAFAHGNGATPGEFPGGANNNSAVLEPIDPLFFNGAFFKANGNAIDGIVQGFTVHSPMCTDHYSEPGHA